MKPELTTSSQDRILVVDDQPANLRLLTKMLSERGYKVRVAPNGKFALKSSKLTPPDLILLDIMMPDMNGYQVCQQLKADEKTRNIAVIFLSALNDVFNKVKAFEVGAADYISKPLQEQEVIARIENQLSIRRLQKQLASENTRLQQEIIIRQQAETSLSQSERKYRDLVETSQDMVWSVNMEGNYTFVNQAVKKIYGYEPEEMIGRPFSSFLLSSEIAKSRQLFKNIVRGKSLFQYEIINLTKGGREISLLCSAIAQRDEQGNVIGITGTASDISQRKQVQKELRRSEALLNTIVTNTSDGILIIDRQGLVRFVNPAAAKLLGKKPDEIVNCELELPLLTNKPTEVQIVYPGKASLIVETKAAETEWEGEAVYVVSLRDITQRKQTAETISSIFAGTASTTGSHFLRDCVRYLAKILGVPYSLIAECVDEDKTKVRTLAFWTGATWSQNIEYNLENTPCDNLLRGEHCIYSQDLPTLLPQGQNLFQLKAKSCFGIPLIGSNGKTVGILVVLDVKPIVYHPDKERILKIFAARAGAELERLQAEEALQQSELREREKANQLEQTLKELKLTQIQLIQSKKMSSLGQIVAGIAHEINNPVSFISGNIDIARQYFRDLISLLQLYQQTYPNVTPEIQALVEEIEFDFVLEDCPKLLSSMQVGGDRIKQIVSSLRNFSRLDEAKLKAVDIHQGIDNTLSLLQHRLKAVGERPAITLIKNYSQLPKVNCYASELNQVFMNLFSNAIDALEEELVKAENLDKIPTLMIRTELSNQESQENTDSIIIGIADNGPGMSEEVVEKIFEPFFTTKPTGSGTGLGLAISYQIVVEKHKGQIHCTSVLGQGTEFIVEIPLSTNASIKDEE
ncbi:MAG: PAS domain S-box protein, partial [Coleofasciculaceae cyanobacterium]